MSHSSPVSNSNSAKGSTQSPTPPSSSGSEGRTKIGRPNKWTPSRQRELVRLYLYSILPPKDISKALKDSEEGWIPGKESTVKTVNALLNHDPRWLRPKNREEMDERILALSECKAQRKIRRKPSSPENLQTFQPFDALPSTEFSETPLEDLLALAPQEPFKSIITLSTPVHNEGEDCSSGSEESRKDSSGSDNPSESFTPPEFDAKTLSLSPSLRRRLSKYSTTYVKAIARLMKAHSISDSSAAATTGPTYTLSIKTADGSTIGTRTIQSSSSVKRASKVPRPVLASVFLTLDRLIQRQGVCFPGLKNHDSNTCWCAVADAVENYSSDRIWVSRAGLLRPLDTRVNFRDNFGNTVLHNIAARDADIPAIVAALERGADPNAKNAAGQNFLHVLPRRFLRSLAENDWNGLIWVLQRLNRFKVRYQDCDTFGRNFFHLVTHRGAVLDHNEFQVLKFLHIELIPSRDAFGWEATVEAEVSTSSSGHGPVPLRFSGSPVVADLSLSGANYRKPLVEKGSPVSALLKAEATVSSEEQAFLSKHARLIEAARMAFEVPRIEDLEGRNGLQCLAEASLTLSIDSENTHSGTSNKRKRGQADADASSMRLVLRYELVQQMIAAGVNLNNYDKQGNTVLMSFLTHLHDGEDDKTLAKLLRHIIQSGADVHLRNKYGESALHVAVRLGRKMATRVLLENGANVHARTLEGKGVLAVGEMNYFRAREDQALYASIHACMALTVQYGAKATPSLVQEWQLYDDE